MGKAIILQERSKRILKLGEIRLLLRYRIVIKLIESELVYAINLY
jgi:hypothetical protein